MLVLSRQLSSSLISTLAYDVDLRRLVIELRDGAQYTYSDVPQKLFDGMPSGSGAGAFFVRHIKGRFHTQKTRNAFVTRYG